MLIKSLVAIGLGMIVSFPLAPGILTVLERPLIRFGDDLSRMAVSAAAVSNLRASGEFAGLANRLAALEQQVAELRGATPAPAVGGAQAEPAPDSSLAPLPAPETKQPQARPSAQEIAARYFISTGPAEPFILLLKLSGWAGVIFSFPFVLYFIAEFVFPGLTAKEKRILMPVASSGFLLFLVGLCFCYFLTLPQAMRVMLGVHRMMGVGVAWKLPDYIKFVTQLLLAFGVAFEMPMVILALVKLGLVSSAALRARRRHVIVGIFVVAMFLTPPDVYTQVMLAIPMCVLYEICILVARVIEKRAAAEEEDEGEDDEQGPKKPASGAAPPELTAGSEGTGDPAPPAASA